MVAARRLWGVGSAVVVQGLRCPEARGTSLGQRLNPAAVAGRFLSLCHRGSPHPLFLESPYRLFFFFCSCWLFLCLFLLILSLIQLLLQSSEFIKKLCLLLLGFSFISSESFGQMEGMKVPLQLFYLLFWLMLG